MKRTIFAAYSALLIVIITARCMMGDIEGTAEPSPSPSSAAEAQIIRLLEQEQVLDMDIQEYLIGVVAAEMPASFEPEALKSQAVAARSYALYCAAGGKHLNADVCSDYGCCQAWRSTETLRESWGSSFESNYAAISQAVNETEGEYLSYGGEPVFAAFHSSSCGATEDCGAIWGALPYLVSVSSPETAETVPNYISQLEVSALDFRDTVLSEYPEAAFTGEPEDWVQGLETDSSGRISHGLIGGAEISGTELRRLFALRSTAFTLEFTGEGFLFTVTGYGHGVGMSQYGANLLASQGLDYAQILAHYYTNTVLTKL